VSQASTEPALRVGIDSYSYHRYFGEIRAGEEDPGVRWTTWDFVERAAELGVDGVSLETCYLPLDDRSFPERMAARLDDAELVRVLAWGHPGGLELGTSQAKYEELLRLFDHAEVMTSPLVRIVVGTFTHWRQEPEADSIGRLVPMVRDACRQAANRDIELAIETHCALSISALLELIERVDAHNLGVVLDTANVIRVGSDLLEATAKLAPLIKMVHVKDLDLSKADFGDPGGWWPCAPLGKGDLDLTGALGLVLDAGFDGLACVEIATLPPGLDEDEAVAESVAWLQEFAREG